MDSAVSASPRRETVEATAPTGQVAEVLFNQESLTEQPAAERGLALQEFHRTQSAGTLRSMSGASTRAVTTRRDELHAFSREADVMHVVGVVVAISQDVALHRSVSQ